MAIICTPIFELNVVKCASKNRHQKGMCLKVIKLNAQYLLTNLGSILNIIGVYNHLMSTRIFTLIMSKEILRSSENHEENGYRHNLDLLIILH